MGDAFFSHTTGQKALPVGRLATSRMGGQGGVRLPTVRERAGGSLAASASTPAMTSTMTLPAPPRTASSAARSTRPPPSAQSQRDRKKRQPPDQSSSSQPPAGATTTTALEDATAAATAQLLPPDPRNKFAPRCAFTEASDALGRDFSPRENEG